MTRTRTAQITQAILYREGMLGINHKAPAKTSP
jgi:hypothetical protein